MSDSETAAESAVQDTMSAAEQPAASPPPPQDNGIVEHVQKSEQHTIHKTTTVTTHTMNHQHFQEDFVQEQATMIQKWPPLPKDATVVGVKDVDVTLAKEEGQSWGFRIGGGKEFGTPLCIIRVQLGSIAEKLGVQVGDVVNSINGVACAELTHNDAHEAIKRAGNKCLISLTRNIAAKGKIPRPFQTMAPLKDLTNLQPGPEPQYLDAEAPLTNGVNGDASTPAAYYQQHHELTRKQQELLQSQIKQKMQFEECRKRINKAQRIMYTPTPQAEEIVVEDCVTGLERKLPKAGSRYRPSLPLTCAASLHQAFPTKPETFEPFQAKPPAVFQPNVAPGDKPLAKPACAVQCKIPMEWHPPSKLINGQPYKSQHTVCNLGRPQPSQEFLPPADPEQPKEPQRPVAHPLLPVPQPELPKYADDGICLGYKHWN